MKQLVPGACSAMAVLMIVHQPPLSAQTVQQPGPTFAWYAQGIPELSRVSPMHTNRTVTEFSFSQTLATASSQWRQFSATGTLDLEGVTLRNGELDPGIYGEGFVDRRHPHTYVHELVGSWSPTAAISLAAGKGFAPFGSDDPMMRAFAKYPVDHHLSQIPERLVTIVAWRSGPMLMEASLFNGDEPTGPSSVPHWSRFGDSRSARATWTSFHGLVVSASLASVKSPEEPSGNGLDQIKWNVWSQAHRVLPNGGRLTAFGERSYTVERSNDQDQYHSGAWLTELGWTGKASSVSVRYEDADRPEEERTSDPFRTPVPPPDANILGITRFKAATLNVMHNMNWHRVTLSPFVEGAIAVASERTPGSVFNPTTFYGSSHIRMLTIGFRVGAGGKMPMMGHYGVAASSAAAPAMEDMPGMGGV